MVLLSLLDNATVNNLHLAYVGRRMYNKEKGSSQLTTMMGSLVREMNQENVNVKYTKTLIGLLAVQNNNNTKICKKL